MAIWAYAIAFFLSLISIYLLVNIDRSQNIRYFLLMFVAIAISNAGYLALVTSGSLDMAILANQISYLGGCFLPLLIFKSISKIFDFKIPRLLLTVLCIYSLLVFIMVLSIGYSKLYYADVMIEQRHGLTFLEKTYGPLHNCYTIMLFAYLAASLFVIIYSSKKKRKVSYRNTVWILISEFLVLFTYTIERVVHADFEYMAFAYLLFEIVILALVRRMSMYDVKGSVLNAQNYDEKWAYVLFDNRKRYTGCNTLTETFFPEFREIKVDACVDSKKHPYLYEHFITWIDNCTKLNTDCHMEEEQIIQRNGMELKCTLRYLYYGKHRKIIGYMLEVTDDTRQQEYIKLLNHYNTQLEDAVQKQTAHILDMQNKMILGMANIVESRDNSTGGHIKRTSEVVRILVEELKCENLFTDIFTKEYCEYIVKAAPMHDLGKIAIEDRVLKKPGKYTREEYEEMKKHAANGAQIVETILKDVEDEPFVNISKNITHYHHEKWDGTGYPEGLHGDAIPLEARIMALADVYDAIVSKRCYKEKMPYDQAVIIIEESIGKHFDPVIGAAFLKCREQVEAFYQNAEES